MNADLLENAIFDIGQNIAAGGEITADKGRPDVLARQLLLAAPPRLASGEFVARPDEPVVDFAVRVAGDLDETVLAI